MPTGDVGATGAAGGSGVGAAAAAAAAVPAALDDEALAAMRADMEAELKRQLLEARQAAGNGGNGGSGGSGGCGELAPEEVERIRREAAAKVEEQAAALEAERARALADAERYGRKQRQLQERRAAKALEGEQLAAAKEALRARLEAMEGKIIKVRVWWQQQQGAVAAATGGSATIGLPVWLSTPRSWRRNTAVLFQLPSFLSALLSAADAQNSNTQKTP